MNYVFGPVPSRRLGFSLGVDIIPFKTCTLDCVYCQLGKTTCKTVERKEYVDCREVLAEVEKALTSSRSIDYVTLSGRGEPTLNLKAGEIIRKTKEMSNIPVAVLTSGTLLTDRILWEELKSSDLIIPSLDAATQETFNRINRPHPSLEIDKIIEGLVGFRKVYEGEIWLEIMLVEGLNDNEEELGILKRAIERIRPDRIQLNTPVRPPAEKRLGILSSGRLSGIKEFLGDRCEVIGGFEGRKQKAYVENLENEILALITRRPVTSDDIASSLGLDMDEAMKYLESLERENKISSGMHQGKKHFGKEHKEGREERGERHESPN